MLSVAEPIQLAAPIRNISIRAPIHLCRALSEQGKPGLLFGWPVFADVYQDEMLHVQGGEKAQVTVRVECDKSLLVGCQHAVQLVAKEGLGTLEVSVQDIAGAAQELRRLRVARQARRNKGPECGAHSVMGFLLDRVPARFGPGFYIPREHS